MFAKLAITCSCFIVYALPLPVKNHPPVWEFTYQYELFEKIYQQTQYLLREIMRLSNVYMEKRCPVNWKTGNEMCYFLALHRKLDWYQSQEACERVGGYLAVIGDEQEDGFISTLTSDLIELEENDLDRLWIGGFSNRKSDTWLWVTGNNMSYARWRTEQEVSEKGGQHCTIWSEEGWTASKCSKNHHYLCEKEP